MRNAGQEAQAGIKIAVRNINNLLAAYRYAAPLQYSRLENPMDGRPW